MLPRRPVSGENAVAQQRSELLISPLADAEVGELSGQDGLDVARLGGQDGEGAAKGGGDDGPSPLGSEAGEDEVFEEVGAFVGEDLVDAVETPGKIAAGEDGRLTVVGAGEGFEVGGGAVGLVDEGEDVG